MKIIKSIILSLLSFLSILLYFDKLYSSYDFLLMILFFSILYVYYKFNTFSNKKIFRYVSVLSFIFSITLSIGNVTLQYIADSTANFINLKNLIKISVMFVGFMPIFIRIFYFLFDKLSNVNIVNDNQKLTLKYGFIISIVIFAFWMPYFLRFFPAIMTMDSFYIINNVKNFILSDHHTFGFTWFFGLFFNIGNIIFKNDNIAIAFYTLIQMFCLSSVFGFSIRYFYNRGVNKIICLILIFFFALNPLFGYYSVTLWRDILFGGALLVIFVQLNDYVFNKFKFSKKNIILISIATIGLLFFRNNGIYVLILASILICIIDKINRKGILIYSIGIIIFYFLIKGPVFDLIKVSKSITSEGYSIPLQQIARVLAKDEEISNNEKKFLKNIFDLEYIADVYSPSISDRVKEQVNNNFMNENKIKFFKVWLQLFIKHPNTYFESYFSQTLGYWYPNVQYWATAGDSISIFDENIHTEPIVKINVIDKLTSRKLPFSFLIWSVGLNFYILSFFTIFVLYKYSFDLKKFIPFIPLYALWLTMMIASPVFCEFRYIFGIVVCVPFVFLYSIINFNSMKIKK